MGKRPPWILRALTILASWLALAAGPALAQTMVADLPTLTAVYIYNFSQLVDWPPDALPSDDSPFQLCVLGADPAILDKLKRLESRQVKGHPLAVRQLAGLADRRGCHILYFDDPHVMSSAGFSSILGASPILSISSLKGAADAGAIVEFLEKDGKLRWVMNLETARHVQLKISAKVIEIAYALIGGG